MTNREIRNNEGTISNNVKVIDGYALVFNKLSRDLGGFVEIIEPTALDGVLERSDVLCLLNHNEDRGVLARCQFGKGSLGLTIDEIGLKYIFDAPLTSLGEEVTEGIKRGDINTSSFAFKVKSVEWKRNADGTPLRVIKQFEEIFDVSPVYKEAYPDTSVALRSLKEFTLRSLEQYEVPVMEVPIIDETTDEVMDVITIEESVEVSNESEDSIVEVIEDTVVTVIDETPITETNIEVIEVIEPVAEEIRSIEINLDDYFKNYENKIKALNEFTGIN